MSQKHVIETLLRFKGDISQITEATENIQKQFGNLKPTAALEKGFLNTLSKLQSELGSFEAKAARGVTSMADSRALESSGKKVLDLYDQIKNQIKVMGKLSDTEMKKLFPDMVSDNVKKAEEALKKYQTAYEKNVREIDKENSKLEEKKKLLEEILQERKRLSKVKPMDDEEYKQRKGAADKAKKNYNKLINERIAKEQEIRAKIDSGAPTTKSGALDKRYGDNAKLLKELEDITKKANEAKAAYEDLKAKVEGEVSESELAAQLEAAGKNAKKAEEDIAKSTKRVEELASAGKKDFSSLVTNLKTLTGLDFSSLDGGKSGIEAIDQALNNLSSEELSKIRNIINTLDADAFKALPALEQLRDKLGGVGDEAKELTDAQRNMENFKNNILQFFSINNAVQLFKQAVSSALNTVKELDAVMTEMAVVTDLDVGDYWEKLPEFSANAKELGVSIKGAYEATTLYLQQGLEMAKAQEVANETLKMARIAGMEAAEATDMMTSALRGFNMEINEESAQRINDVYSELAAVTASNAQEIATAMTKTASLASSANMEFETTSAILAQIIETTREAPETAGTALKTIIARFQELKKAPSEIGEVDGEIVDANKIEGALRTIGVALRDTNGQFRDLDDVFLEIASKWKTLDVNTQRYIATIAAGSRQQSRFIAMMSDYGRTMELVDAANTSAGSSQKQYEKTLESLETKLNQLSVAWQTFLMGIANNEAIKLGVDILTGILEAINKLLDSLSMGSGLIKTLLSVGLVMGSLKVGQIALNKAFESMGSAFFEGAKKARELDGAKKKLSITQQKGLAYTLKENLALLFGGESARKAALDNLGLAAAKAVETDVTGKATIAQWNLNAALLACPIGWVALMIAVAVGAIVIFEKVTEDAAEKTERLNEEMEAAADAANLTQTAYEELQNSFNEYDAAQTALSELTRGTDEWREALVKANNEVIELLEKYPQLAEYLERGEDGQLVLSAEGRAKFVEEQKAGVVQAQQAVVGAKMYVTANAWDNEVSEFNENFRRSDGSYDLATRDALLDLYRSNPQELFGVKDTDFTGAELYALANSGAEGMKKAKKIWEAEGLDTAYGSLEENFYLGERWFDSNVQGLKLYSDALYDIAINSERTADDLYRMADSVAEYGESRLDYEKQMEGQVVSLLAVGASDALASSEYSSIIQDAFVGQINLDTFDEDVEKEAKKYKDWSEEKLTERYLSKTGLTELPEKIASGGEKALIDALATLDVVNPVVDLMNKFYQGFSTANKSQKDSAMKLIQKEGKGFTRGMVEEYEKLIADGMTQEEAIAEYYTSQTGQSIEDVAKSIGMNKDEFVNMLLENARMASEGFDMATEELERVGVTWDTSKLNNFNTLSSGSYQQLADHIYQTVMITGASGAEALATKINDKLGKIKDPATAEKFVTLLNAIDWSSQESISGFSDSLEEMGLVTGFTEEEIDALESDMIKLNKATKDLTFEKVIEQVKNLDELSKEIEDRGRGDYHFTETDKRLLVEAGVDEDKFVLNGVDDWVYIGGEIEGLLTDINTKVGQILGELNQDLKTKIERGSKWADAAKGTFGNRGLSALEIIEALVNDEDMELQLSKAELKALVKEVGADVARDGSRLSLENLAVQDLANILATRYAEDYGEGGAVYLGALKEQESNTTMGRALSYAYTSTSDLVQGKVTGSESILEERALIARARSLGVSSDIIEEFEAAASESSIYSDSAAKIKIGNAIAIKEAREELGKVASEINEIIDNYKDLNIFTEEHAKTISEIFGFDDFLGIKEGTDFVLKNIKLIKNALGGEAGALENLVTGIVGEKGYQIKEGKLFKDGELVELSGLVKSELSSLIDSGLFTIQFDKKMVYQSVVDEGSGVSLDELASEERTYQFLQLASPEDLMHALENYTGEVEDDSAENNLDRQYNILQNINKKKREREKLERDYNNMVEEGVSGGEKLLELSNQELNNLKLQKIEQGKLLQGRMTELDDLLAENQEYVTAELVKYDKANNTIEIDWEEIDKLAENNPDEYEKISDFISGLEDIQGEIDKTNDELDDIDENVKKIKERGKDEYYDLETRILEALVERDLKEVEELEEINDSINSAADDMVNAIQTSINKMRQDRENEDTEQSIAEKERRLAYLRQDTSGANALEIKKLEKEIADEKEAYGDTLVDQALQDLQDQNDKAAEQRERQITLMREQIEYNKDSGYYAAEAHRILEETLESGGLFEEGSEFYQLITTTEGWGTMAHSKQMQALEDIQKAIIQAYEYQAQMAANDNDWNTIPVGYEGYDYMAAIDGIITDFKKGDLGFEEAYSLVQRYESTRDNKINTVGSDGKTYGEKYGVKATGGQLTQGFYNKYKDEPDQFLSKKPAPPSDPAPKPTPTTPVVTPSEEDKTTQEPEQVPVSNQDPKTEVVPETYTSPLAQLPERELLSAAEILLLQKGLNRIFENDEQSGLDKIAEDGINGKQTQQALATLQGMIGVPDDGKWGPQTYRALHTKNYQHLLQYKTGGLADFTGPAWLDGTRSRPELVLNAQDTENFLFLKDVLSSLLHLPASGSTVGDSYFDINIQVDELADDYDVDQMVERVKQKIYEDGMYRNNNMLNLLR